MTTATTTPTAHNLEAGDHLSYSWGYDQTNIDYFIVTRTTAKSVWIAPVQSMVVESEVSFMTDVVRPTFHRKTQAIVDWAQQDPETGGGLVVGEELVPEVRKVPRFSAYTETWLLEMPHGVACKVDAFAEHRESHYA